MLTEQPLNGGRLQQEDHMSIRRHKVGSQGLTASVETNGVLEEVTLANEVAGERCYPAEMKAIQE
jgi:outer membrane lipopolysaccharide assembly protein LptE/RlpB